MSFRAIHISAPLQTGIPAGWTVVEPRKPNETVLQFEHLGTDHYTVTLEADPELTIRSVSVCFKRCGSQKLKPLYPKTEILGIKDELEKRLRAQFFSLGLERDKGGGPLDPECPAYTSLSWSVGNALQYLLYQAPIASMDPNRAIVKARLSSHDTREYFLGIMCRMRYQRVEYAEMVSDLLPELHPVSAAEAAVAVLTHLQNFEPEAQTRIRNDILTSLMLVIEREQVAGFLDAISEYCLSGYGELPETFAEAATDATIRRFNEPGLIDTWSEQKKIAAFFKAVPDFPPHMMSASVERVASHLLDRGRPATLLAGLTGLCGRHGDIFVRPQGDRTDLCDLRLPSTVAHRMVSALRDEHEVGDFLRVLRFFPEFPTLEFASLLDKKGWYRVLAQGLGCFQNLPSSLAVRLSLNGHGSAVTHHLSAFVLTDSDRYLLGKIAMEQGDEDGFARALQLSDDILERLEPEFSLRSYKEEIAIPSYPVYLRYCNLRRENDAAGIQKLSADLKRLSRSLISSEPFPEDLRSAEWLGIMLESQYPDHSARGTRQALPADLSDHLRAFSFAPCYTLDLSEGVEVERVNKRALDEHGLNRRLEPFRAAIERLMPHSRNRDHLLRALDEALDSHRQQLPPMAETREEKLFALSLECCAGNFAAESLKPLVCMYHFCQGDDLESYVDGTRDQVSRAKNGEYASLLLYRELLSDQIVETLRKLSDRASGNQALIAHYSTLGAGIAQARYDQGKKALLARSRGEDLGVTPRLLTTISAKMRSVQGEARATQISKVISTSQKRFRDAYVALLGSEPSNADIHLEDCSFAAIDRDFKRQIENPEWRRTSFSRFLKESRRLFESDADFVSDELKQYKSKERPGKQLRPIQAYFTKNAPSSLARRVAGLCVASDTAPMHNTPAIRSLSGDHSQWSLTNYFQLVLKDPRLDRCEGLVLLHHYNDNGRKILTASFNPTSTLLLKVDERQLFHALLGILTEFAKDNGFDMLCCSASEIIRTNRTGGEFEVALNEQISRINRAVSLSTPQAFSFSPSYYQQNLHVLWCGS